MDPDVSGSAFYFGKLQKLLKVTRLPKTKVKALES